MYPSGNSIRVSMSIWTGIEYVVIKSRRYSPLLSLMCTSPAKDNEAIKKNKQQ